MNYESPMITELGSVADFTRGEGVEREFDGIHFHITSRGRLGITIDMTGPGRGS